MELPSGNEHGLADTASSATPRLALVLGVVALVASLAVFRIFDPAQHRFFPQCTFHALTGLDCPGCGGQRAVHCLLHGEIRAAVHANALLVLLLPAGGWLLLRFGLRRGAGRTLPALFLNQVGFWGLVAALLLFGVARNLPGCAWLRP